MHPQDGRPLTLIRPLDEPNRRHLANVHPEGYTNPAPKDRYHMVVIGAGPGGLVAAAASAALGARVALVERHLMGGDCLNVGCVPSKGVIRAARAWHEARRGAETTAGGRPGVDNRAVRHGCRRLDFSFVCFLCFGFGIIRVAPRLRVRRGSARPIGLIPVARDRSDV